MDLCHWGDIYWTPNINMIFHWKEQLELSRVKRLSTLDWHEWVI